MRIILGGSKIGGIVAAAVVCGPRRDSRQGNGTCDCMRPDLLPWHAVAYTMLGEYVLGATGVIP